MSSTYTDLTALDIETETAGGGGLDPTASRVVAVALAFSDRGPLVFEQEDEVALLRALDEVLRTRDGLLVTWNGAGFDLPFIAVRAEILGLDLGLVYCRDAAIPAKYPAPEGLGVPVRARWGSLEHVDAAHLYQDLAAANGIPWSLKPVARHLGMTPVEVDRTAIHELSAEELTAYVVSDAVVTLDLAARFPVEDLRAAVLAL